MNKKTIITFSIMLLTIIGLSISTILFATKKNIAEKTLEYKAENKNIVLSGYKYNQSMLLEFDIEHTAYITDIDSNLIQIGKLKITKVIKEDRVHVPSGYSYYLYNYTVFIDENGMQKIIDLDNRYFAVKFDDAKAK